MKNTLQSYEFNDIAAIFLQGFLFVLSFS